MAERPKTFVVIGGGVLEDETAEATLQVRAALPADWQVLFRPHPFERPTLRERYPSIMGVRGIEIDLEPDVLATLSRARAAWGTASTVLYEAVGLGCDVIVLRSDRFTGLYVDPSAFPKPVSNGAELAKRVAALDARTPTVEESAIESLWAPDPRARFASFASGFL